MRAPGVVRVMTWNIHGALGRNPRFDLDRVVAFVQRHAPDVVALQEIDSRRSRPLGVPNPFDALCEALGPHDARAAAIATVDGDYGQALISRWPMRNAAVHDLSYPEREPRRAIRCDIDTPSGPLRAIATHLGLSLHERRAQAQKLLALVGEARGAVVALGDFNDWLWAGSVRTTLKRALPGFTRHATFPAALPLLGLDRVYVRPRQALLRSGTDRSARRLSDHLPVFADLTLPATADQ